MAVDLESGELVDLAEQLGFSVVEQLELPARDATVLPVPDNLHPDLAAYLDSLYPEGLYSHQTVGLAAATEGHDVVLSTATASGKSLVYMAAAADLLLREEEARVLALYPARALIQDQIAKWSEFRRFDVRVGHIDGGVPQDERESIVDEHNVVLMTPDVAHAWLLRQAGDPHIARFLKGVRAVILDEAHVYEGVFGTNMAYFLRRLLALVDSSLQITISTATMSDPEAFAYKLTGRRVRCCLSEADDGSRAPDKTVLLSQAGSFSDTARLLSVVARSAKSPFLAFADSRKQVERLVAATRRESSKDEAAAAAEGVGSANDDQMFRRILPYRAGYEDRDRMKIQRALEQGELAGVVSTSALELGIDIGDINLVLLLTTPPSVKAFHQRLGRGARRRRGVCLILDDTGSIAMQGLTAYLERPSEPNRLYLDNRYLQYINVLCAARELEQVRKEPSEVSVFATLPERFRLLLQNEMYPAEPVPEDLFPLKQRGEANPHHEFPLRGGMEKQFRVRGHRPPGEGDLGTLTFSQVLREAYPGAIYYYLARPYRVYGFNYTSGELIVRREKAWTTTPMSQSMVFPNLSEGILQLAINPDKTGFMAESYVQVSERVLGFREKRGAAKAFKQEYGPGSRYYQRPLSNFFETTGVCFYFAEGPFLSEDAVLALKDVFCAEFGILERDVSVGHFTANVSPVSRTRVSGLCVYDAVPGSLRLTKILFEEFADLAVKAFEFASSREEISEQQLNSLIELADIAPSLRREPRATLTRAEGPGEEWATVIASGETATLLTGTPREVTVLRYRYTPIGIMYDLEDPNLDRWAVSEEQVRPHYGETRMLDINLVTGEECPRGFYSEPPE